MMIYFFSRRNSIYLLTYLCLRIYLPPRNFQPFAYWFLYLCDWDNCSHVLSSIYWWPAQGGLLLCCASDDAIPASECRPPPCTGILLYSYSHCWIKEKEGGGERGQGHDEKIINRERGGGLGWCSGLSGGPPKGMSKS